ncbi:hypothetical protein IPC71_30330 [Pseudomonas aeruginosa]|nr:hypothetical protein IPC71_30330 [Pseudomonas aeruginosa]
MKEIRRLRSYGCYCLTERGLIHHLTFGGVDEAEVHELFPDYPAGFQIGSISQDNCEVGARYR